MNPVVEGLSNLGNSWGL